jgi:4-amino-4-deoxy-L-arabinose transferase-like glycosyltransferase
MEERSSAAGAETTIRGVWAALRERPELIWLGAILVLAGIAYFATLGLQSFDSGETITATRIIHPSYADTFTAYSTIERSGPLYYTLAWGWSHLFGLGEVGLRSLSAIFGLATILVVFLIGRELFSRRAAVIAAALAACNPDLFWYAQEARSYPLFILLTATALYFFVRTLRRPSRGAFAGWAIASALALSTHYFAAFTIGPEALWLLVVNRRRAKEPLMAIGAVAMVGLALLPLVIQQEGAGRSNSFAAIPVLERGGSALVKFVAGETAATSGEWARIPVLARTMGIVALLLCAIAILVLFARGRLAERRAAAAVGAVGAAAFTVPLLMALGGIDFVEPRNLLGSLVPMLVVVAGGVDVAIRSLEGRAARAMRLVPAVGVALPLAAMVVLTWVLPGLQRDDWRDIGRLVLASGRSGVIYTEPSSAGKALHYYLDEHLPSLGPANFPCGVRTGRIITVSHRLPEAVTGRFHLVSSVETDQHWTVAVYASRGPQRLDPQMLQSLDILGTHSEARVDDARPVVPRVFQKGLTALAVRFASHAVAPGRAPGKTCVAPRGAGRLGRA